MPYMCVVKGCNHNSKSHKGICGFYRIPRVKENENEETKKLQEDRRRQWIQNIYRRDLEKINLNNTRVCGYHFVSGNFCIL